ncbi:MAG: serine hydrolase domain-containing protein [Bacteroidota bacterium]
MPYHKLYPFAFLLLVLLMGESACSSRELSENEKIDLQLDSLRNELNAIKRKKFSLVFQELHRQGKFNGNILVIEKGQMLFEGSYGWADFRDSSRLEINTLFPLCSVSSQFTTILALLYEEEGKLDLEAYVQKYLAEWPYPEVRVKHLLSHSSGIPDYLDYFLDQSSDGFSYARNQNVMAWIKNEQPALEFFPGDRWSYSPSNYVILAEICESLEMQKFPEIMQEKLFFPLGMEHTFVSDAFDSTFTLKRAFGFYPDHQRLYDHNFLDKIYGERGVYSNLEDLFIWDQALYNFPGLSPASLKKLYQPLILNDSTSYPYGFSWFLGPDKKFIYQMGGWLGFRVLYLKMPQDQISVIVLSNDVNSMLDQIRNLAYNIMYNKPYRLPR